MATFTLVFCRLLYSIKFEMSNCIVGLGRPSEPLINEVLLFLDYFIHRIKKYLLYSMLRSNTMFLHILSDWLYAELGGRRENLMVIQRSQRLAG